MSTPNSLMSQRSASGSVSGFAHARMSAARMHSRRAFTLVEVMGATVIFTIAILGVYQVMLRSYEMVTMARHRDNARAIISSFADEFQRLQTTDANPGGGAPILRTLFYADGIPTGAGLTWTDAAGRTTPGTSSGLPVTLGENSSSLVNAVVTREVHNISSSTGITQNGITASAAGWMLQATFKIEYDVNGHHQIVKLIIARSVR